MIRAIHIFLFLIYPILLLAQNPNGDYNPYVNAGTISPAPLWPVEENGSGQISFNIGNSGSDPLEVFTDQYITLTITLSYGDPDNADPLAAISGSYAELFSWRYNSGTYSATQIYDIPGNSSGTIIIDYKVTQNSSSPGLNGFNVNISPAPYQTESNSQNDDAVSSYTYTEIRDYGDAPESYGIPYHILDYDNYLGALVDGETSNQPSPQADADDLNSLDDDDGILFPELIQRGETINISVTVKGVGRLNAWIDWNGDGDFEDVEERIATNVPRFDGTVDLAVNIPSNAIISAPTFARFRFSPGSLSSPSGAATGGEVEDYYITVTSSPLAPSVPTGLKIDSSSVDYVSISWDASPSEEQVTSYNIYRNGSFLDSTPELYYIDLTVNPGNLYTYAISAVNSTALESDLTTAVTANTQDTDPPAIPEGLKITSVSESGIGFSWEASTDNVGVTGYNIFRDGTFLTNTTELSYNDTDVSVGNSYTYSISAYDAEGNESEPCEGVMASINDITAPSVPQGLTAVSITVYEVEFAWEPSTDNVGVSGYRIYRGGTYLGNTPDTAYTDNSVLPGNDYVYKVSAFDDAGNESGQSSSLPVNTNDIEAPSIPTGLYIISFTDSTVSLTWNASTDNVGVAGYLVYRDGNLLDATADIEYTDNSINSDSTYIYSISAVDEAGNESGMSDPVISSNIDNLPPSIPTGLVANSASGGGLSLKWEPSTDNFGVAGYRVFRDGNLLTTVNSASNIDRSVVGGKTYSYSVSAFDEAGNESSQSDTLTISITSSDFLIVSKLSIAPNPSTGTFRIKINEESGRFNLEIISAEGIKVIHHIVDMNESSVQLELGNLARGFYFIRLYNDERIYDGKLIIVK